MTKLSDKQQALLKRYQPMSGSQLREVIRDYFGTFSGWTLFEDGTGFFRDTGPLRQMIWFQTMSGAQYRPTHVMRTTILPQPRMLTQLLDVRNREIKLTWHQDKWRNVLAAMEQQFRPSVRKELDVADVLSLCKTEARSESTSDLVMLGILHAWLGQSAEALAVCESAQHCPLPVIAPVPEWEEAMRAFGRELAAAVREGNGRSFLEARIGNASHISSNNT